ncbi:MAG: type II toxin-antitoxin system Phd/YefM family antitoxin [Caldilineaceae bacterium]
MRRKIGIRELKNDLTAIVRRVGEERVEYTVTVHGRPVAVLRPLSTADAAEHAADDVQAELAALAELAQMIGEDWTAPESALQTLEQMREESAWR